MYSYNICNQPDNKLFQKSVNKLKNIPDMKYINTLKDVDDSLTAKFTYRNGNVFIKNDEIVGALYIESDKDIEDLIYDKN